VVAHFHYVLIGGVLLGLLGGLYYWVPKFFGKMMNQKLGYAMFWLILIGFNLAFFPMHYLGLTGMPRRTHTYQEGFGFSDWNFVSTIGAFLLGIGILIAFIDIVVTIASKKRRCNHDPWDARTLEWSLPSPVPTYNFAATPVVSARDCWWEHKHGLKKLEYMPVDKGGIHMPSQSWFPLLCGVGFTVFGISMAMLGAGIPYAGWVAIGGLLTVTLGIYLWALEGPGGYHIQPEPSDLPEESPDPEPTRETVSA
ncbi:MAG: cbb3-type cytochrome c oxidase subunit I, partial [Verrucomicrobiota bacterium]